MLAVTSYFNPMKSRRRLANYRTFRSRLDVPLVTVELAFDGQFELTSGDADHLIQLSGGDIMWQKERLLNIGIKSIPSAVKNFAWIDCDILFGRRDWAKEAEERLNEQYSLVQLFSNAIYLNKEDSGERLSDCAFYPSVPGVVALYRKDNVLPLDRLAVSEQGALVFNPGLAWAARMEIFAKHGFYDRAIIGAGDLYVANSAFGTMNSLTKLHSLNEPRAESYLQWGMPFHRTVASKVGCVPGEIYHLWHGDAKNRNYRDRFKVLADFNPDADVYVGDNGAWHWTKPKSALADQLKAHFVNRREDG